MDNKLRIERLTELQGMLTHHDQLFKKVARFDIRSWFETGRAFRDCGTAACALGSACLHKPFIKQGLGLTTVFHDHHKYPTINGKDYERDGWSVGAEFFGITYGESEYLFDPGHYYPGHYYNADDYGLDEKPVQNVKPEHVAKRVEKLINKYKGENNES